MRVIDINCYLRGITAHISSAGALAGPAQRHSDEYHIANQRTNSQTTLGFLGIGIPVAVIGMVSALNPAHAQSGATPYYSANDGGTPQANSDGRGAIGQFSTAAGAGTVATSELSSALGYSVTVNGAKASAFGANSIADGAETAAFGYKSKAFASSATALGALTEATGLAATAVGANSSAAGEAATSVGFMSKATGFRANAVGTSSEASGAGALALGTDANASIDNSVALGAASITNGTQTATSAGTTTYASATIAGQTYGYAAGAAVGVVSVGSAGAERRIQNVAAGLVTATSTDAINGSQLYAGISNLQVQINNLTNTGGGGGSGGGGGGGDPGLSQQVSQNTADIAGLQGRMDRIATDMNTGFATLRSEMTKKEKLANAGIASAAAIGMIRYDDRPGKFSTGSAITSHRRQAAISVGAGYTSESGNWRFSAAGAFSPTNWKAEATVGASATYTWN
ncbi:MAG: YadA-like family protein [Chelatococcus sp.]|uniref:YadA-like family protein n=1 Tax=Chelatococcus sp. TaxID=1953771 RepID=UPI0025BB7F2E|nr:YadA-like family protein [Chelatococcus sp.]MBX3536086.1 YadA-like family protein [Chelatococcus sp.]